MATVSELWIVRWSPTQDALDISRLSEVVDYAQECFLERKFVDWQVLAVHPNKTAAQDEAHVCQERRNARSFPPSMRLAALQPHIEGLESSAVLEDHGDS
jgi:hypothetical protein